MAAPIAAASQPLLLRKPDSSFFVFVMPSKLLQIILAVFTLATQVAAQAAAQNRPGRVPPAEDSLFSSWGLYVGLAAIIVLVGVIVFRRKKEAEVATIANAPAGEEGVRLRYRKGEAKPLVSKKEPAPPPMEPNDIAKKAGITFLPVSSFKKLQRSNHFIQLPDSYDPALLDAIEQVSEDSEEDTAARTQALKLLATFKTANSVSAISQMALYDLSSKLRSDAVQVLAEMDHESVFETIVTCCADPTREVRASAARALFKLSFDRSHCWARIVESNDRVRMRHVARCAIEGDLVDRSFDRLINIDRKIAYEAFTLTALLIRAGETEPIYRALALHRDEKVKLALLHVLQIIKEDETFEDLSDLLNHHQLTPELVAKINEVRSSVQMAHAR